MIAEKGFHATSIREICSKAQANVAAVHYHFGDKEMLREEVLVQVHQYGADDHPIEDVTQAELPPEDQLLAFVRRFLLTWLGPARPTWHEVLIFRELTNPGPNMKAVVERGVRKNSEALFGILSHLLGGSAPQDVVERCQHSVIGQLIHYTHHRRVVEIIHPGLIVTSPEGIEVMARHITEFSLAAARNIHLPDPADDLPRGGT